MHEIHLGQDKEETLSKRGVAFKTTSEEHYFSEDKCTEGDEDSIAMIGRGSNKIFKSKRFDPKKLYKKVSSLKRNEICSEGNNPLKKKNESNLGPCFGCRCQGILRKIV